MEIPVSADTPQSPAVNEASDNRVILYDGTTCDLSGLGPEELKALQFEQERGFARRILDAAPRSSQRATAVREAYDTVTKIFAATTGTPGEPTVMGLDYRYERLVWTLLVRQRARGMNPRFFEIGYAGGVLLRRVSGWGFPIAGIEVSASLQAEARRWLGGGHQDGLLLGDLLDYEPDSPEDRHTLIYWNDVLEHIPPDEVPDYLGKIHDLLVPGGQLVTITPNWHERPSDVTADVCPPRTEAMGLHLKEYTLGEVTTLLDEAGFDRVATPLFVGRRRMWFCGSGFAGVKRLLEPCLEWLPFGLTLMFCRRLGLSCTVATKSDR